MNDPIQMLIDAGAIPSVPFDAQSRYNGVPLALHTARPGEPPLAYVKRRFVPAPSSVAVAARHVVSAMERPDLLGAKYFAEPLLYWRIADANAVVDPNELTDTMGRRILIPVIGG
ncbi:MAG: Base plate wedge protein 53 [Rhizobacter sp.]|nr:Base plate wedge protein 53 [Rhizobacter sp.]